MVLWLVSLSTSWMNVMKICIVHALNHRKELKTEQIIFTTIPARVGYAAHQKTELYLQETKKQRFSFYRVQHTNKHEEQLPSGVGEPDVNW